MLSTRRRRALAAAGVLVVAMTGWLTLRAWQAAGALLEARAGIEAAAGGLMTDGEGLDVARAGASRELARARSAVDDPLWRVAAAVPLAGRSFSAVRQATGVAEVLVDGVLPPAVRAMDAIEQGRLLADGQVDLELLERLRGEVEDASTAAEQARSAVQELPRRLLLEPVAERTAGLSAEVIRLADGLHTARAGLQLAPAMLGAHSPRRYFLAVHNNAETRGTGGLIGAYVVLTADRGRLATEAVGTNNDFLTAPAPVVDLGPQFSDLYDQDDGRTYWASAVRTPDWPSAASVIAGLWQAQGGGQVDGVVGVDPLAMAEVLAVTGPVQVGARTIRAADVADFVMRDEYAEFVGDEAGRAAVLGELAGGLYAAVTAGGYSGPAMLQALADAGGTGHLQVFSARPVEQAVLAPLRVGGALPAVPGPYLQVVSNNAAGNKADYYVRRRVGYERTARGEAVVTVALTNTVVASEVPSYVTGRLDNPRFAVEPGQTRLLLAVYVGVGDVVRRVLVDGVEAAAQISTERGHGVATVFVEVRPSRPTVVTVEVTDPGGTLVYRQQPLVVDDALDLDVPYRTG